MCPGRFRVGRSDMGIGQRRDGGSPVGCRDPGRRAVPVVDADGEGGALHLGIGRDHQRQVELLDPFRGQRYTDQPGSVGNKESNLLRGDGIGRHDQVALVLPILVVHHHDDLASGHCRYCIFDRRERHRSCSLSVPAISRVADPVPLGSSPFPVFLLFLMDPDRLVNRPDRRPTSDQRAQAGGRVDNSTRRSPSRLVTDRTEPRHSAETVGAPAPANSGRASSPPNRAGARYST